MAVKLKISEMIGGKNQHEEVKKGGSEENKESFRDIVLFDTVKSHGDIEIKCANLNDFFKCFDINNVFSIPNPYKFSTSS
jgi:hypothetical protein